MEFVILGFFAVMVAVVVSTPALIALGFFIKTRAWSNSRKKIVFITMGAFLACPVLLPAGTIAAIPLPNWIVCGLLAWKDPGEILTLPLWYAKVWHIHGPFLLGVAVLLTWLAQIVIFIPLQRIPKSLEPQDSSAV